MTPDEKKDLEIRFNAVREMIVHEDNLIGQRSSRMLATQTILFSAFVLLENDAILRNYAVPGLGLILALLSGYSVRLAAKGVKNLQEWYHAAKPDEPEGPGHLPPVIGHDTKGSVSRILLPWILRPYLVAAFWSVVLFGSITEKSWVNVGVDLQPALQEDTAEDKSEGKSDE